MLGRPLLPTEEARKMWKLPTYGMIADGVACMSVLSGRDSLDSGGMSLETVVASTW